MTIRAMKLASGLAMLALLASPLAAEDLSARSKARIEAMEKVLGLSFEKHKKLVESLKLGLGDDFYNCLCRQAGYGSSSTSQFYHPGTIGDYNPKYSCNQPGDPCVVSGFGCMRYPLPKDQKTWEYCSGKYPSTTGVGFTDAVRDALDKRNPPAAPDYQKLYQQCRGQKRIQDEVDRGREKADGFEYLANNKTPVLPPPPDVARKLQREEEQAQTNIFNAVRAAKKESGEKKNWVADMADSTLKNKGHYLEAAKLASDMALFGKLDTQRKLRELKEDFKKLDVPNYDPELEQQRIRRRQDLEARQRKLTSDFKQYERDESHLESFVKGVDAANDIKEMADALGKITSGDPRTQVEGALANAKIVQKYFDKARAPGAEFADDLTKLMKKQGGLDPVDYKRLTSLQNRNEILEGASQAMDHVLWTGDLALKTYDGYQKFLAEIDRAEKFAQSGRYSETQRNLLNAFHVLSELGSAAQPYLPPGISEMMDYYVEAMKTPAKFDELIRKAVDRGADVEAERVGEQARTKVMDKFVNEFGTGRLLIDPYLYREAGLSAYEIDKGTGNKQFVLMPNADGDPIYLSAENYRKLQEMAYYYPLAEGRRMTDSDVLEQFGNIGARGTVNIDSIRNKALQNIKDAADKQRAARLFGKKTVSGEEYGLYKDFIYAMRAALPAGCVLDPETKRKLFAAYREDPNSEGALDAMWRKVTGAPGTQRGRESVKEFLISYGDKLKRAKFEIDNKSK